MKKCSEANCKALVNFTVDYCETHKHLSGLYDKQRYSNDKAVRSTYNSKVWANLRKAVFMRDNYLCCYCLYAGVIESAVVADHYIPIRDAYDLRYDRENIISSCNSCNTKKFYDEKRLRNNDITFEEYKDNWKYVINKD